MIESPSALQTGRMLIRLLQYRPDGVVLLEWSADRRVV